MAGSDLQTTPSASTTYAFSNHLSILPSAQGQETYVCLRVHSHPWHGIIKLHVLLTNFSTVLDNLYALPQVVGPDGPCFNGSFGHKRDRCVRYEGLPLIRIIAHFNG